MGTLTLELNLDEISEIYYQHSSNMDLHQIIKTDAFYGTMIGEKEEFITARQQGIDNACLEYLTNSKKEDKDRWKKAGNLMKSAGARMDENTMTQAYEVLCQEGEDNQDINYPIDLSFLAEQHEIKPSTDLAQKAMRTSFNLGKDYANGLVGRITSIKNNTGVTIPNDLSKDVMGWYLQTLPKRQTKPQHFETICKNLGYEPGPKELFEVVWPIINKSPDEHINDYKNSWLKFAVSKFGKELNDEEIQKLYLQTVRTIHIPFLSCEPDTEKEEVSGFTPRGSSLTDACKWIRKNTGKGINQKTHDEALQIIDKKEKQAKRDGYTWVKFPKSVKYINSCLHMERILNPTLL